MAKISKERKMAFYIGTGMMVIGFILFISVFFSFIFIMNNPFGMGPGSFMARPIIGMILMISGSVVRTIGARGAAGSGLVLDPEKAREDLKPFSEATGSIINDVVSNIDLLDKDDDSHEKEIIKIRCKSCKSLNDEDAKFCKSCGQEL